MQAGDPAGPRVLVLGLAFPVGVRLWEPQIEAFSGLAADDASVAKVRRERPHR